MLAIDKRSWQIWHLRLGPLSDLERYSQFRLRGAALREYRGDTRVLCRRDGLRDRARLPDLGQFPRRRDAADAEDPRAVAGLG